MLGVNHFVPLWKVELLGEDKHTKLLQAPNDEIQNLKEGIKTMGSSVEDQSQRETAEQRLKCLENWKEMQDCLPPSGRQLLLYSDV